MTKPNRQAQQFEIVVGTSAPRFYQLTNDGGTLIGTGFTVALSISKLVDGAPTAIESAPSVEWLDQAAGTVRVSGLEVLTLGNYLVRYKLTDLDDEIDYCPNDGPADIWRVVPVPAR
jgi:hypothetical protein